MRWTQYISFLSSFGADYRDLDIELGALVNYFWVLRGRVLSLRP